MNETKLTNLTEHRQTQKPLDKFDIILRNWSQSYEPGSQPWTAWSLRSLPGAPAFRGSRPTPVPLSAWDATQAPSFKNARKFWNDFTFRRRSDFQSIVALRNKEVQQKTCHTIPFQQQVGHEGCETVAVKNNLCFGQCGPGHAPRSGAGGPHALCSCCAPMKVARRTVELKCSGDTRASKVVTMVEECQCELRRGRHCVHHRGPVLIDPSLPEKHS
uniref:CTCK domain-containing protein n=1 Tax=Scleropages formosus TaxID=113540 RepID=A0A8C9QUQ2_SCLFO